MPRSESREATSALYNTERSQNGSCTYFLLASELRWGNARFNRAQHGLRLNLSASMSGVHPGGGFFSGARAREENLCLSSALFTTLVGDKVYERARTAGSASIFQ